MRKLWILSLLAMLLWSCGDEEHFRVSGTIEGNPTMNLRVTYVSDGVYNQLITAAREGAFEFQGSAPSGTVVEVTDYDRKVLGRFYALNGQEFTLRLDRSNPWLIQASGNEPTAEWSRFMRDNAGLGADRAAVNAAIAQYVGANPANIVSTLLLITSFDASADAAAADSLMQLIDPAARPAALTEGFNFLLQRMVAEGASEPVMPFRYFDRRDSLKTFRPSEAEYSLLVFDTNRSGRADSIVPAIKDLLDGRRKNRVKVLELSLDGDTIEWKRSTRRDTATWAQAWAAGGFAARGVANLGVPDTPYFIVCDSTGRQILRTRSVALATDSIRKLLNTR